ncbi:MAG TPA: hypothetical protein VHX65_19875 [Pirellulales bacterium]|jgi:hypothetical protein|nr:hypothetical protein [Pirellulales bacterium]
MPWFASDDDRYTWRAIAEWGETARSEVEDIDLNRDEPHRKVFPQSREGNGEPKDFEYYTQRICSWMARKFPAIDPTAILDVYAAVNVWHTDWNAERIPPQNELDSTLSRAKFLITAAMNEIESRLLSSPPAKNSSKRTSGEQPDGPGEGERVFFWRGRAYSLAKKSWELVREVWNSEMVPFDQIGAAVWGDECTPAGTIKSQVARLNNALADFGIPISWECTGEHICRSNVPVAN